MPRNYLITIFLCITNCFAKEVEVYNEHIYNITIPTNAIDIEWFSQHEEDQQSVEKIILGTTTADELKHKIQQEKEISTDLILYSPLELGIWRLIALKNLCNQHSSIEACNLSIPYGESHQTNTDKEIISRYTQKTSRNLSYSTKSILNISSTNPQKDDAKYEKIISTFSNKNNIKTKKPIAKIKPPTNNTNPYPNEKISVILNSENEELIDVSKLCLREASTKAILILLITSPEYQYAWPAFKDKWNKCVDTWIEEKKPSIAQTYSIKNIKRSDFVIRNIIHNSNKR